MLITIEGSDKAGKTTQLQLLEAYAKENSLQWIFTRNPGGSTLGSRIREMVLNPAHSISDRAELMLYLADRAQHVEEFIKPNIAKGNVVICDRFVDSSVAYQGYGRGLDTHTIEQMNEFVLGGQSVDLSIFLLVSEAVAAKRSNGVKDRLEMENKEFFRKVREGYRAIAKAHPERIKVIDTNTLSVEEVFEKMKAIIIDAV